MKIKMKRMSGKTAGSYDCYWLSPKKRYRLRSMVEVKQFIVALQYYDVYKQHNYNGDDNETIAKHNMRMFYIKTKKPKNNTVAAAAAATPGIVGAGGGTMTATTTTKQNLSSSFKSIIAN